MKKITLLVSALVLTVATSVAQYSYTLISNNIDGVNTSKAEYAYDKNGNRTLWITYTWDSDLNNWKGVRKDVSTYDSDGHQTLYFQNLWDNELNDWKPSSQKEEYTYDNNGNKTQAIRHTWDNELNDCIVSYKWEYNNEYTYDENGKITLVMTTWQYEVDGDWKTSDKQEYAYDSDGNQTNNGNRIQYIKKSCICVLMYSQTFTYSNGFFIILLGFIVFCRFNVI